MLLKVNVSLSHFAQILTISIFERPRYKLTVLIFTKQYILTHLRNIKIINTQANLFFLLEQFSNNSLALSTLLHFFQIFGFEMRNETMRLLEKKVFKMKSSIDRAFIP